MYVRPLYELRASACRRARMFLVQWARCQNAAAALKAAVAQRENVTRSRTNQATSSSTQCISCSSSELYGHNVI